MGLTKEELEERRAARRAARGASPEAREQQIAADREAIDSLEIELDQELDTSLYVLNFVPGCPVLLGVRRPTEGEYKRYFQTLNRQTNNPDQKSTAYTQLAEACWAYPKPEDKDVRRKLLAANGGLLVQVGQVATKLAEAAKEEEGKG